MDQTEKQTKETDVELLCKYIYDYGEQYMDGTAAIIFSKLKQVGFFFKLFEICTSDGLSTRNQGRIGFWKCCGEIGLRQVEQDFSSNFWRQI